MKQVIDLLLDEVEDLLRKSRYLAGSTFTLADIRLFTTLVRFDLVYNGLFMANLKVLVTTFLFFLGPMPPRCPHHSPSCVEDP